MMQYALHFMLLKMAFASIREGLRLVANPTDDIPAEYLEKAKQQGALLKGQQGQPQQQPELAQQSQRRKQDFMGYE